MCYSVSSFMVIPVPDSILVGLVGLNITAKEQTNS